MGSPRSKPASPSKPADGSNDPSVDDELQKWKESRTSGFKNLWQQLSLMISLCFGIAFFVLPDSVSSNMQWLLFALTGASLYAWVRKRRDARRRPAETAPSG